MKKLFISLISLALSTSALTGQNVARECVLFEVFTGIGCPYCPAAANGIAEMLEEGCQIAPLAYHTSAFSSNEYYTTETNARASYYGISSYPTLKADGILSISGGGGASESMYSYYISRYNQRISMPSPFTIDIECSAPVGTEYTVTCTVNEVGTSTSSNMKVHIALSQSNIPQSWQGLETLNHVVRDMIPNQNGTAYQGGELVITETFDMKDYPKEDCYLTAWVQDASTKEVYQAVRLSLNYPDFEHDVAIKSVSDIATHNCSGTSNAYVEVKNNGSEPITSFDVVVYADNNEVAREHWTGDAINFTETAFINIPTFNLNGVDEIEISAENPNGVDDENPINTRIVTFDAPLNGDEFIIFVYKTANDFEETTVEWINMNTGVVEQTITYDQPNKIFDDELYFNELGCYRLAVYDSGNNGVSTYFTVYDKNQTAIFNGQPRVNPFNSMIAIEFDATVLGIEDNASEVTIFPNPTDGQLNITTGYDVYNLSIFDVCGKIVYSNEAATDGMLDVSHFNKGMYLLKIQHNDAIISKKVIIE